MSGVISCGPPVSNDNFFENFVLQFSGLVSKRRKMYHERQRLQFCALHVLNNLFQEETFCKQDLDDICYSLSPDATVNPHKSFLGLGNYDVNVLTMALQTKDYQFIWFDKRK